MENPEIDPESRSSAEAENQPSWASKWKAASRRWARENSLVYFANPAARRDFRVQFRGNRSAWLFATFLVILSTIALFEYWRIVVHNPSIESAQNSLNEFYEVVIGCLGVAVGLVAPALSATAIVAEKQRRSLDLVFSSPMKPKSYLVGKIIANYRYIWIMLALSLPVTAMCVMLGGASWSDVLETYFLLSIQGVVFTSIGLFFSSITERAISAVIYTYVGVVAYLGLTAMFAAMSSTWENGYTINSMFAALNPFMLYTVVGTSTTILGVAIPNALLALGASWLVVRLLILGAGSFLVPPKPVERAMLRYSLIGTMALTMGYLVGTTQVSNDVSHSGQVLGAILFMGTIPLVAFMPFLSCYGFDAENRFLPNGWFKWRARFAGTPASALPTVLTTVGAGALSVAVCAHMGAGANISFVPYMLYVASFWTFFWSVGRLTSSYLVGLKVARLLQFVTFVVILGVPLMILSWIASGPNGSESAALALHPLYPLFANHSEPGLALVYAVVFFAGSAGVFRFAESNLRARLAQRTTKRMERASRGSEATAI